jgi:hypothetical protein
MNSRQKNWHSSFVKYIDMDGNVHFGKWLKWCSGCRRARNNNTRHKQISKDRRSARFLKVVLNGPDILASLDSLIRELEQM